MDEIIDITKGDDIHERALTYPDTDADRELGMTHTDYNSMPVINGTGYQNLVRQNEWMRENGYDNPIQPVGIEGVGDSYYDQYIGGLEDLKDLNEVRAREQGVIPTIASGILQGGAETLNTGIGNIIAPFVGIFQGIENMTDDNPETTFWQGLWNNVVTETQQKIRDAVQEATPIYQSKYEQAMSPLRYFFTDNFWGEFLSSMGFRSGMILSTVLTGGMGAGSAVANILKAAGATQKTVNFGYRLTSGIMGAISEASMEGLNNYNDTKQHYAEQAAELYRAQKADLEDRINKEIFDAIVRANPSLLTGSPQRNYQQEAEIEEAIRMKYANETAQIDQQYLNNQSTVENRALSAGSMTFGLNMAILGLSNTFGTLSFLKYPSSNAKRQIAKGKFQRLKELFSEKNAAKPYGEGISKTEARLVALREALAEGFEESNQKWASTLAEQYYGSDYDPEATEQFGRFLETASSSFKSTYTDPDTWREFLAGALTGLLGSFNPGGIAKKRNPGEKVKVSDFWQGGIFEAMREGRELSERSRTHYDEMNGFANNKKLQSEVRASLFRIASKKRQMEAAAKGDKFEFENENDKQAIRMARMFADAGRLNEFEALVGTNDELSDEEFDELCVGLTRGTNDGKYESDYDYLLTENRERISDLEKDDPRRKAAKEKIAKESKRIHDIIRTYQKAINDADEATGYQLSPEKLDFIAWGVTQSKNWKDRIKSMYKKDVFQKFIQKLGEEYDNFITEGEEAKKNIESYNDKINAIDEEYESKNRHKNVDEAILTKLNNDINRLEKKLTHDKNGNERKKPLTKKAKADIERKIASLKKKISEIESIRNKQAEEGEKVIKGGIAAAQKEELEKFKKEKGETINDLFAIMNSINIDNTELGKNHISAFVKLAELFLEDGQEKADIMEMLNDMRKCLNASNNLSNYINGVMSDPSQIDEVISSIQNNYNEQVKNSVESELEESLNQINSQGNEIVASDDDGAWSEEELNGQIEWRLGDEESNSIKNTKDAYEKALENAKRRLRASMVFDSKLTQEQIDKKVDAIVKKAISNTRSKNKNLDSFLVAYELTKQFSDLFDEIVDDVNINGLDKVSQARKVAQKLFEAANIYAFSHGIHPILLRRENLVDLFESIGYNLDNETERAALIFVNKIYRHIENNLNSIQSTGKIYDTSLQESDDTKSIDGAQPTTAPLYDEESAIFTKYDKKIVEENPQWGRGDSKKSPLPPSPPPPPPQRKEEKKLTELPKQKPSPIDDSPAQKKISRVIDDIYDNQSITGEEEPGDEKVEKFSSAISLIESTIALGYPISPEQREVLNAAKQRLKDAGYTYVDFNKARYEQGMNVTVANYMTDSTMPNNVNVIDFVFTPQLEKSGKVFQKAVVRVKQGVATPGKGNTGNEERSAILSVHSKEYEDKAAANNRTIVEDRINPAARKMMEQENGFTFIASGGLIKLLKDNNGKVEVYASRMRDENGDMIPDTVFLYVKTGAQNYQMIGYVDSLHGNKQSKIASSILGISRDDKYGTTVTGTYTLRNGTVVTGVNLDVAEIPIDEKPILLKNANGEPMRIIGVEDGQYFMDDKAHPIADIPVGMTTFREAYKNGKAFIVYNGSFIGNANSEVSLKEYETKGLSIMVKDAQDKWVLLNVNTKSAIDLLTQEPYDKTNPFEAENVVVKKIKERIYEAAQAYVKREKEIFLSNLTERQKSDLRMKNAYSAIGQIFNQSSRYFYHSGISFDKFTYIDEYGNTKNNNSFEEYYDANTGKMIFQLWARQDAVDEHGKQIPAKRKLIAKFIFDSRQLNDYPMEDAAKKLFNDLFAQFIDREYVSDEIKIGFRKKFYEEQGYVDSVINCLECSNRSFLRQNNTVSMMYLDENAPVPDVTAAYGHGRKQNGKLTGENSNTITIGNAVYAITRKPDKDNTGYADGVVIKRIDENTNLNKAQMSGRSSQDFKEELKKAIDPDGILTMEEFSTILLQMWENNQEEVTEIDKKTGEEVVYHYNHGEIGNHSGAKYEYTVNGKTVKYDTENKRLVLSEDKKPVNENEFYSENGKELVFYRGFSADEFNTDFASTSQKASDYANGVQNWVHSSSSIEEASEYAKVHSEKDGKPKQIAKIRFPGSARVRHFKDTHDYIRKYDNGEVNLDEIDVIILDQGTLTDGQSEAIARPSVVIAENANIESEKPTPVAPQPTPVTSQPTPVAPAVENTDTKQPPQKPIQDEQGEKKEWEEVKMASFNYEDDERNEEGQYNNANIVLKQGFFNAYLFFRDFIKENASLLSSIDRELIDFIMPNIDKKMVVKILNKAQWESLKKKKALPDNVLGLHSKDGNVIFLPETTDVTTYLHEMAHAATVKYINQLFEQNQLSAPTLEELDKIYQKILEVHERNPEILKSIEGTSNFLSKENRLAALKEFAAEGLSNKQLQDFMKGIKIKEDEQQQLEDRKAKPSAFRRFGQWVKNVITRSGIQESKAERIVEYTLFDKFKENILSLPKSKEKEIAIRENSRSNKYKVRAISSPRNKDTEIVVYDTNTKAGAGKIEEVDLNGYLRKFDDDGGWSEEYRSLNYEFTEKTGRTFDMNDHSPYGVATKRMFFEMLIDKGYKGVDMATGDELTGTKFASTSYIVSFGDNYKTGSELSAEINDTNDVVSNLSEDSINELVMC